MLALKNLKETICHFVENVSSFFSLIKMCLYFQGSFALSVPSGYINGTLSSSILADTIFQASNKRGESQLSKWSTSLQAWDKMWELAKLSSV